LGTGAGLSLTTADNIIDTRNGGVTGDAGAIRIARQELRAPDLLPVSVGLLSGERRLFETRQPARCLALVQHEVAAYSFGKIGPEPCEKSGSTLIATPSVSSQLSAALPASDEDWIPIMAQE